MNFNILNLEIIPYVNEKVLMGNMSILLITIKFTSSKIIDINILNEKFTHNNDSYFLYSMTVLIILNDNKIFKTKKSASSKHQLE